MVSARKAKSETLHLRSATYRAFAVQTAFMATFVGQPACPIFRFENSIHGATLKEECFRNLISCTLHFGFNYEINYQLEAIKYLFALSSFSSTCFGLIRPSSGAMGVTILTNVAYGVLGFCLVRCRSSGPTPYQSVCVHPLYMLQPLFLVLFYFLYYVLCSSFLPHTLILFFT